MIFKDIDFQIGLRLRVLRMRNRLSIAEFARAAGITNARLIEFENGDARIDAPLLAGMCRILNVRPLAFFDWLPTAQIIAHFDASGEALKNVEFVRV